MKGDKIFLDSNILCYAADFDDKVRHPVAQRITEELQHSGHGYISTQVLQETYNVITKKLKFPIYKAREFIGFVRCIEVYVNTADDIMSAIDISEKHQISFWDSLIVNAAMVCGCDTLYTEDLNNGQMIEGIAVINPFIEVAHE